MKLIPVRDLIQDRSMLLIDDFHRARHTAAGNHGIPVFQRSEGGSYPSGLPAAALRLQISELLPVPPREMDLITRRVIRDMEGEGRHVDLDAYADPESERYQTMVENIGKQLNFTSLRYNRLDDMIDLRRHRPVASCVRIAGMGKE